MEATQRIENVSPAVWGFTGTVLWAVLIAAAFFITQGIALGVYVGARYGNAVAGDYGRIAEGILYDGLFLSVSTFCTLIVCGLLILLAVKLKKNATLRHYLGFKPVGLDAAKYWSAAVLVFILVFDSLSLILGKPLIPEYMFRIYKSSEYSWLLWITLILAAPLIEELFFRGFLLQGLSGSFVGPIGAVVISSMLWAAMHVQYDLYFMSSIFVLGLLLGAARLKTGSLVLTLGLHATLNLVATIETAVLAS